MIKKFKNKFFNEKSKGKEKLISIEDGDSPTEISKKIRQVKRNVSQHFNLKNDSVLITPYCGYKFHLNNLSLEDAKKMFDFNNLNHLINVDMIIRKNIYSPEVEKYLKKARPKYEERMAQAMESEAFIKLDQSSKKEFLEIDKSNFVRHYIEFSPQLFYLLEKPTKIEKFKEILNEFGIENLECFVNYYHKLNEVKIKKKKDKWSDRFSDLVDKEVFLCGEDIPIAELLDLINLADLNYILLPIKSKTIEKKNEALPILENRSDAYDLLSQKIPIEDCYLLNFNNKFNDKNNAVWLIETLQYYEAYEDIIFKTFDKAFECSMGLADKYMYIYNSCCRKSSHLNGEELYAEEVPVLPHHPGCSCWCEVKNSTDLVMKL